MRLRIDMRYFPDARRHAVHDRSAGAEVGADDLRARSPTCGSPSPIRDGARLEVCGEDDLCILKNKNPKKCDYWARPEKEIVDDVLRRANFPLPLAEPAIPWPTFTESAGKALAEAHFEGQSYLEYLMKFAERWDFEVFIEYVSLDDPNSGLEFHFEPCRCRTPPDKTFREVYIVERGKNLIEFNPDLRVVDQWTSVTFCGHDHSWTNPAQIQATAPKNPNPLLPFPGPAANPDPVADELHIDAARGDEPLTSGPEWRRRKFGLNPHTEINQRGIDEERAQVMAESLLPQARARVPQGRDRDDRAAAAPRRQARRVPRHAPAVRRLLLRREIGAHLRRRRVPHAISPRAGRACPSGPSRPGRDHGFLRQRVRRPGPPAPRAQRRRHLHRQGDRPHERRHLLGAVPRHGRRRALGPRAHDDAQRGQQARHVLDARGRRRGGGRLRRRRHQRPDHPRRALQLPVAHARAGQAVEREQHPHHRVAQRPRGHVRRFAVGRQGDGEDQGGAVPRARRHASREDHAEDAQGDLPRHRRGDRHVDAQGAALRS